MTQTQDKPKPPPLHDRGQVFAVIAARYIGGKELELVQERFLGAGQLLNGTGIPKEHDPLHEGIKADAASIQLADHPEVLDLLDWIMKEKQRAADEAAAKEAEKTGGGPSSAKATTISPGLDGPARMDAMC